MRRKWTFSKLLLLLESAVVLYTTYEGFALARLAVGYGYLGTLPWVAATVSAAWGAYGALALLRAEARAGCGAVVGLQSSPEQIAAGAPERRFAAVRGNEDIACFVRADESETLLCAVNRAWQPAGLALPAPFENAAPVIGDGRIENGVLSLPAESGGIFLVKTV